MFSIFNKLNAAGANEEFVGTPAKITSFSIEKANSNGTPYHSFAADVATKAGDRKISGKVYSALIPHLGATPKVGDVLNVNTLKADLEAGFNTRWNIGGSAVSDATDILKDILG